MSGDDRGAGDPPPSEEGTERGEWRYSLSDLEDDEDGGEGVWGPFSPDQEIEPQEVDLENVVFVLLGAIVAIVGVYLMLP